MDAHDAVSLDGKVHDPNRQDYMHRYLRALGQAVADGVPVLGYFYWSFSIISSGRMGIRSASVWFM